MTPPSSSDSTRREVPASSGRPRKPLVVPARLRRGARGPNGRLCGETDREVHFVPAPAVGVLPDTVTALCGTVFQRDEAERVHGRTGVPCTVCYMGFLRPRSRPAERPDSPWRNW